MTAVEAVAAFAAFILAINLARLIAIRQTSLTSSETILVWTPAGTVAVR